MLVSCHELIIDNTWNEHYKVYISENCNIC